LDHVDIYRSRSDELDLDGVMLRFAHIDGGHTYDVALHDLRLAASHLAPRGIVAVDDYQHPDWHDVTAAVDTFVAESGFSVVADVNRWAESGRKIYLSRPRRRESDPAR
jgi:Methyltransferase domain